MNSENCELPITEKNADEYNSARLFYNIYLCPQLDIKMCTYRVANN
jgi:hypothetical protein